MGKRMAEAIYAGGQRDNINFRCLDLGFGNVTGQTAAKECHMTATCDS